MVLPEAFLFADIVLSTLRNVSEGLVVYLKVNRTTHRTRAPFYGDGELDYGVGEKVGTDKKHTSVFG